MLPPLNLHSSCDRCDITFDVCHALSCIKGGLVISRHNEVCDKLLYLFPESLHIIIIRQFRTRSERRVRQGSEKYKETRGDVMIWGLWDQQAEAIIDIKIGDADADS